MILSRKKIEAELMRILQDASPEIVPRIRQRINDVIAEVTGMENNWLHLSVMTTFQTLDVITKGSVSMPKGSTQITYVAGSTDTHVKGRKIIVGKDGLSYVIAKVSSQTLIIADKPREVTGVTTQSVQIVQDTYEVPTIVDKIEDIVNLSAATQNDGTLDFMTRRELDQKFPSTVDLGTPLRYLWENDTVTTFGTGNITGYVSSGTVTVAAGSILRQNLKEGMFVRIGSTRRTLKDIGTSGSIFHTYEGAPETFTSLAGWDIEKRIQRVRLHPMPTSILRFAVRYYRKEFGIHRGSDSWSAPSKFHHIIIDGVAAKMLAEIGKDPARAAIYEKRYNAGIAAMKKDTYHTPDDTEPAMRVNLLGMKYIDTWK